MDRTRRFCSVSGLVLCVFLLGCGGSQQLTSESPQAAFEEGQRLYEEGNYTRAVEAFRQVFNFGRAHQWADEAQFYLARSYLENEQYVLAADEYSRYLDLYGNSSRAEQAEFERALAYYRLSPPYSLDQSDTQQGITYLRLFLERYPGSEHVDRAGQMLQELREKLAHKEYAAAELYERREYYESAALAYQRVLEQYPETSWADDALLGVIDAYRKYAEASVQSRRKERYQQAVDAYERFLQLFPDSPLVKDAEALYTQVQNQMEDLQG